MEPYRVWTTRSEDGTWSVVVDGVLVLSGETYQVANNVAAALMGQDVGHSESAEIAASIRRRFV